MIDESILEIKHYANFYEDQFIKIKGGRIWDRMMKNLIPFLCTQNCTH